MKFGLKFRENYGQVADGAVGEEFDNIVAFLQVLWDKILDSEGNIKTLVTNNNQYGGAGVKPTYITLNESIAGINGNLDGISSQLGEGLLFADVTAPLARVLTMLTGDALQLVPSPGAGAVITPLWFLFESNVIVLSGSNPNLTVRWKGTTTTFTLGSATLTTQRHFLNLIDVFTLVPSFNTAPTPSVAFAEDGAALEIFLTAAPTGGTFDATLRFIVAYYISRPLFS